MGAIMPTFIPEWNRVSGRNLHVKKVLNTLEESCVIRRPIRPSGWTPDLFVQHPAQGWLALAVCDLPFAALDPAQLFESEQRASFEAMLTNFRDLDAVHAANNRALEKVLVLWACSSEEARLLSAEYLGRYGLRFWAKERFLQLGEKLIPRLLAPLEREHEQALLGRFFPEAEIPAVCTTRRYFKRDNSARLAPQLTRFFLDSEQEWAAKLDLEPSREQADTVKDFSVRLVNGVAGSGKTLIALNRALMLAELFPAQRILVLIHNTPIVADIRERLVRAHNRIPPNLEINTFFGWAHQQWRSVFRAPLNMPENPRDVPALIRHYRAQWRELKQGDVQLHEELDFINEALIVSEEQYLTASRTGRGFALRPKERTQVLALHEAVTAALRKDGRRMWSAVPREICLAPNRQRLQTYRHILVDEAQFFAPSWFHVVKLCVQEEGQLFLCADPNQGFMKSRLSWKSVGLDVAGRTKKLRKSYRTTRAILEAADNMLGQYVQADPEEFLAPDFAGMEPGKAPILIYTESPQDAVDRLGNELAAIAAQGRLPLSSLLVIYGDGIQKGLLYEQLGKRLGSERVWWLNKNGQKKEPPGGHGPDYLRLAYIDTATGLEGCVVFLIGVENLFFGHDIPGLEEAERAARSEQNARKLYMAMTRAGLRLVLVSAQRLPAGIEALFERLE